MLAKNNTTAVEADDSGWKHAEYSERRDWPIDWRWQWARARARCKMPPPWRPPRQCYSAFVPITLSFTVFLCRALLWNWRKFLLKWKPLGQDLLEVRRGSFSKFKKLLRERKGSFETYRKRGEDYQQGQESDKADTELVTSSIKSNHQIIYSWLLYAP